MARKIYIRDFLRSHKREIALTVGSVLLAGFVHNRQCEKSYSMGFIDGQRNAAELISNSKSPKLLD